MEKSQTIIFFIRHGQTNRPYINNPELDSPRQLTEEGREQLKIVGEYLQSFAPTAVYSSPLLRTVQSAEIIRQAAGVETEIEERRELYEIYYTEGYEAMGERITGFLRDLSQRHAGEHLVCVSHQDVIQEALMLLGAAAEETEFPCRMGEGYRLVFADSVLVECQKIRPA